MERTAAEARAEYEKAMGLEIGAIYAELWQETGRIHALWEEFVTLFGVSEARINMLNEAAGAFFRKVQDTFWEAVLLGLARITDPPQSVGKPNLSIRKLEASIADAGLRPSVTMKVQVALDAAAFCRDWRNRRIAHNDLDLAVDPTKATPLPPASRDDVNRALDALVAVLDAVSLHYSNSTSHFRLGRAIGGAKDLLFTLRDGLTEHDARMARLQAGQPFEHDLHPVAIP